MQLDAVVFGGGVAGLWTLDELVRQGCSAMLVEAGRLGEGQTVASQGILHGGLKYTLAGLLTQSARHVREMPAVWRECLAGTRSPDLTETRVRAESCYLWRTDSLQSRLGMMGARFGLRVAPTNLSVQERPAVLARCPGSVARLDEQVIAPASLVANLAARHRKRVLRIDALDGLEFVAEGGRVESITLRNPDSSERLELRPRQVVLAAGAGNGELRKRVGLPHAAMQLRPLHMVLVRGDRLPVLNGHCIDGARTRVTITSDTDAAGRVVWQVGGQIAEEGVDLDERALLVKARAEIEACVPGIDLSGAEWSTYRVDRAEAVTLGGKRPETFQVLEDGNVLTVWPTKLVLAPRLARDIARLVPARSTPLIFDTLVTNQWPRPEVALPPWETADRWHSLDVTPPLERVA